MGTGGQVRQGTGPPPDASGNTTGITYPNGQVVSESYTPDGQVASITDWLGNTTSYTYGPDGNPDTEAFASNEAETRYEAQVP